MMPSPTFAEDEAMLRDAGIRPTRQRLAVARRIREGGRRHLTPEDFHEELAQHGLPVSLATVYNTLNQFVTAGLLKRLTLAERTFFCTNTSEHHHFYDEDTGRLLDIQGAQPQLQALPNPPGGERISGVDIVVRVRSRT